MENPFAGMNPYLERHWRDVRHRIAVYARDQIAPRLPHDVRARMDEREFVRSEAELQHEMYPSLILVRPPRFATANRVSGIATAEPLRVELPSTRVHECFIKIVKAGTQDEVITVIEFLSLSNKVPGKGRTEYRKKQRECGEGGVSLVEIDLLRAGKRVLAIPESQTPREYRTPYRVCVTRGWRPKAFEIYSLPLREPLPAIRVPLRESEPDVALELQPLIDQCYRNAAYDDIDYTSEPYPALGAEDADWADKLLRDKGLRK